MPFINVNISKNLTNDQKNTLQLKIGEIIPVISGKTIGNTMTKIDAGCDIFMGGKAVEAVFCDIRFFTAAPMDQKTELIKQLSDAFNELFGIPMGNIYINLIELDHWGSGGRYM